MKKLSVIFSLILLSSCSSHLYSTHNYNVSETQVVLNEANFVVVGKAEGSASITQVLGIGGLSRKSLKGNAVADMYSKANLTGSQTIINVHLKHHIAGLYPLFAQITYTATGTIIEFFEGEKPIRVSKTPAQDPNNEAYTPIESQQYGDTKEPTAFGEEVVYNGVEAIIVKVDDQEATLAAISNKAGSWHEAVEYCTSLGEEWRLPTTREFKAIRREIRDDAYWTAEEVSSKHAKYYGWSYNDSFYSNKNSSFYILPIATVEVEELER